MKIKNSILLVLGLGLALSLQAQQEKPPMVKKSEPMSEMAPPPPPPPPPAPNAEPPPPPPMPPQEVFKVVEQMPRFPGCEDMKGSEREKEVCAKDKMMQYIAENLIYPEALKESGREGTVVIQFVVAKDGVLKDVEILRDLGDGAGEAAADVIHKMNKDGVKWIPGKQRGKNVSVVFALPVKFKMEKQK